MTFNNQCFRCYIVIFWARSKSFSSFEQWTCSCTNYAKSPASHFVNIVNC